MLLSAPSQGCCFSFHFASQRCVLPLPPTTASGNITHDGRYLSWPGLCGVPIYSYTRSYKLICSGNAQLKCFPLHRPMRLSVACNASPNNYRRNPDFSRQQKGSSRGRGKHYQEREDSENSEETDFISSKNGSLLSLSNNPRYQATAIPGQREKEIVELFRKVQAQLRERAAIKEEKKIEAAQQGQSERGTVDSLLKLLRKHSVDQRKTTRAEEGLNHDQTESITAFDDEQKLNFPTNVKPEKVDEASPPPSNRPVSNFRRRSPVPRVKFQPVFSAEEEVGSTSVEDISSTTTLKPKGKRKKASGKESKLETDSEPSPLAILDESSVDDQSDLSDSDETKDDSPESSFGEYSGSPDLSALKLAELRDLAKSRGIKGYSKLKKGELVELLNS